jgi:hypothetical protein
MYLCTVLGPGSGTLGMIAYRGQAGMRSYYNILECEPESIGARENTYESDMLCLWLEERDSMAQKDLALTRKLLLNFPSGLWPLFRSYRPHKMPAPLSGDERRIMGLCLEQVVALAAKREKAEEIIRKEEPDKLLVRGMEDDTWRSRYVSVAFSSHEPAPEIKLDDITTQRLRSLPTNGETLEIDLVHFPTPIADREPPYWPLVAMSIGSDGLVQDRGMYMPFEDFYVQAVEAIYQGFLDAGQRPGTLLLRDSTFADAMRQLCDQINLAYGIEPELPQLAEAIRSMDEDILGSMQ